MKHFDGDIVVGSYFKYFGGEKGFFFYDVVADTLEKQIESTNYTNDMHGYDLHVDSAKNLHLLIIQSNSIYYSIKYFGEPDGKMIRLLDTVSFTNPN